MQDGENTLDKSLFTYVSEEGVAIKIRKTAIPCSLSRVEALQHLILEDGVYQTVWNKLYRREVIRDILFPIGKYNEDEFWTYQVLDRISKLATVEAPLYNYLQRNSSIIGVGYNVRRLDCLEARYQRMVYLQKNEELATLIQQQLIFDCMWHLQCVLRYLVDAERKAATEYILHIIKSTPRVPQKKMTTNYKYRIWYVLFRSFPNAIALLRNFLKIGM